MFSSPHFGHLIFTYPDAGETLSKRRLPHFLQFLLILIVSFSPNFIFLHIHIHECKELSVGDVGIFTYDGNGYIKEYDEQEPDDDLREIYLDSQGTLHMQPVLRSFNQKYAPKVIIPDAYFQIVGKVLN